MGPLKPARRTARTAVVSNRGAFGSDGGAKNPANRPPQPPDFVGAQCGCFPEGMDARLKERFVAIDISQPGQRVLIEQQRLDRPLRAQDPPEAREIRRENVTPDRGQRFSHREFASIKQPEAAEAPRVAKTQLSALALQVDDQVRVPSRRFVARPDAQRTGHPQMCEETQSPRQFDLDPLPNAANRPNQASRQQPFRRTRVPVNDVAPGDADAPKPRTPQIVPQGANQGFDFGQLGQFYRSRTRIGRQQGSGPSLELATTGLFGDFARN